MLHFKFKKVTYPLLTILAFFAFWMVISSWDLVNPLFLPSPKETLSSLVSLLKLPATYYSLLYTSLRALLGLLLALIVGIPFGLILAKVRWLHHFFELPIEFFRAIPSSALFPLFILFFGIGDASKVAVVFYACSLIIIINAYYGALPNQDKKDRINMLKTLGATKYQILVHAVLKDAIPNISAGIRVCISFAFALVVVTEMFLSANEGLGKMIYDFYLQYRISDMYASIIILGLTGFVINQLYILFERNYIFWSNQ